jgi:hypothetical protein
MKANQQGYEPWKTSIAASFAMLLSQIFYPLENVKLRFQGKSIHRIHLILTVFLSTANNNAKNNPIPAYTGIYHALNDIYTKEGFNALYRGVVMNIISGILASSIFFYMYEDGKQRYNYDPNNPHSWITMFISYRAGLTT